MHELFTYLVGDEYESMYIIFIMHKYMYITNVDDNNKAVDTVCRVDERSQS